MSATSSEGRTRSSLMAPPISDGPLDTTRSWSMGLWDLPSDVGWKRDPDLGSSLGSVYNLLCDSK